MARDGGTATIDTTEIANNGVFNFGTAFAADGNGTVITVNESVANFAGVAALENETNGGLVIFQFESVGIQNVSKAEGNIGFTLFQLPRHRSPLAPLSANPVIHRRLRDGQRLPADGNDYNTANGTLTILPGQSSGTVAVKVLGDFNSEPDETFFVNLSNAILFTNGAPKAVTLASTQAVGTILNDDFTNIAASISSVSLPEGNQGATATPTPFVFPVTLNVAPTAGQFFTVDYATSNGTADGNDYQTANGTLTFFAGSTTPASPLTVNVIGDTVVEPNETFNVTLSNPQLHFTNAPQTIPGNLGTATAVGTIVNDDVASRRSVVSVSSFSHVREDHADPGQLGLQLHDVHVHHQLHRHLDEQHQGQLDDRQRHRARRSGLPAEFRPGHSDADGHLGDVHRHGVRRQDCGTGRDVLRQSDESGTRRLLQLHARRLDRHGHDRQRRLTPARCV